MDEDKRWRSTSGDLLSPFVAINVYGGQETTPTQVQNAIVEGCHGGVDFLYVVIGNTEEIQGLLFSVTSEVVLSPLIV